MGGMRSRRATIIAAILLLYVSAYLANRMPPSRVDPHFYGPYRFGGEYAEIIFWPLAQIDKTLRPGMWSWD